MANSYFNFPVPKVPQTSDPKLSEVMEPIYAAFSAIYNNFVYACGTVSPPSSEFARLASLPQGTLQPQNLNRLVVAASGALPFGSLVKLVDTAGVITAQTAIGGLGGARAIGYCNVPGGVISGEWAEIIVGSGLLAVAGATVGAKYYLSGTLAGAIALTPPAEGIIQPIGFGVLPNYIYTNFFMND